MQSTENNVGISEDDNKDFQIEHINNEKTLENIGGIIFISLLMIVGFGGNSIAIFVYLRKYKQSTYRTFIVSLAIVDLVTCCVPMPFILLTLRYPINFFNSGVCKLRTFLTYSMCIGSSNILLTIAAERYRKVCVPHGIQLSERMSKYICVLDVMLGILLACPAAVLYGNKTFKTGVDQIVGTECDVSDDFADTKYPAYFNIFLLFIVFAALIGLSLVYAFIVKEIFRMKKTISRKNQTNFSEPYLVIKTQTTECSCSQNSLREEGSKGGIVQNICDDRSNISTISCEESGQGKQSAESKSKSHVFSDGDTDKTDSGSKQNETVSVTRVLFIITVVYFCSFLPHLALRTATFLSKNFLPNLSYAGTVAYQTFRWTFFINNIANPIIYGLYDRKFMQEVRMLFRSCLATCWKID